MPLSCNLFASCFVSSTSPNFLGFPHTTLLENIYCILRPSTFFFFLSFLFFSFSHVLPLLATLDGIGTLECLTVPILVRYLFQRDIGQPNCTTEPENGHCVQHYDLGLLSLKS